MTEIPKPPALAARGGCWFRARRRAAAPGHRARTSAPSRKAHPGLRVTGIEAFAARLDRAGRRVVWDDELPGHRRFYSADPVGNRLEFLEPIGHHPIG